MALPKLDRHEVTTLLTLIIVAVWIVSAVVRIWQPWPEAAILDNLMPLLGTFWFISSAISKNGKHTEKEEVPA